MSGPPSSSQPPSSPSPLRWFVEPSSNTNRLSSAHIPDELLPPGGFTVPENIPNASRSPLTTHPVSPQQATSWYEQISSTLPSHCPICLRRIVVVDRQAISGCTHVFQLLRIRSPDHRCNQYAALNSMRSDSSDVQTDEVEVCAICKDNLYKDVRMEPVAQVDCNGRHKYHRHCILEWLIRSKQCPMCRGDVEKVTREE